MGFEFIGFLYLIVYVGAVAVLFLFMIMLFDKTNYIHNKTGFINITEAIVWVFIILCCYFFIFIYFYLILNYSFFMPFFELDYARHLLILFLEENYVSRYCLLYNELKTFEPLFNVFNSLCIPKYKESWEELEFLRLVCQLYNDILDFEKEQFYNSEAYLRSLDDYSFEADIILNAYVYCLSSRELDTVLYMTNPIYMDFSDKTLDPLLKCIKILESLVITQELEHDLLLFEILKFDFNVSDFNLKLYTQQYIDYTSLHGFGVDFNSVFQSIFKDKIDHYFDIMVDWIENFNNYDFILKYIEGLFLLDEHTLSMLSNTFVETEENWYAIKYSTINSCYISDEEEYFFIYLEVPLIFQWAFNIEYIFIEYNYATNNLFILFQDTVYFIKIWQNISSIGFLVYEYFSTAFIIAGLILLAGMVGAIILTQSIISSYRHKKNMQQNTINQQLRFKKFKK